MSSPTLYSASAAASTYPVRTFPDMQDGTAYSATSPERFDAKYFCKPIVDDLLQHQALLYRLINKGTTVEYDLTGDVNDLDPTGMDDANLLNVTPDVFGWIVTGLAGGFSGRVVTVRNASNEHTVFLGIDDELSLLGNRFLLPIYPEGSSSSSLGSSSVANTYYELQPYDAVQLRYDSVRQAWVKNA